MIRPAFLALCLGLAAPAHAIEIVPVTSPGGISAWLVRDDSLPFVSLSLAFRGGASLDDPAARGAINLMTATLEEGSGDLDAPGFAAAVQGLGAEVSFRVDPDALTVGVQALSENLDATADLVAQALTEPTLAADAVERVRAQVVAGLRQDATDPQSLAAREMARQAWGDHPYASDADGTLDSVAALTPDHLRAAKDRVLARDRVVVGAAGAITPEALGLLIDRILGGLPATGTAPLPSRATLALTGGTTVIDWDSPQTVVSFAGPGIGIDDPDYFAAAVANHVLGGGGFASRLMAEIREERGLTYGVGTDLATGLFGNSWQGGMAGSNETVAEAVALIRQEWARLAAEGVTDAELADGKAFMTGEYPLRFDGNRKIAGILSGMQLIGLDPGYPDRRNALVEAVTAADVQRVARRLMDADGLRFVLVGRPDGITATD